jgi:ribosome-binding protein aMBF1 (putative translation factor)
VPTQGRIEAGMRCVRVCNEKLCVSCIRVQPMTPRHPRAWRPLLLDAEVVRHIRRAAAAGTRTAELARRFRLSQQTIARINKGRTYKDVV